MERTRNQTYTIPGDPISLARPKFGDGRIFDHQKEQKLLTSIYLQSQHDGAPQFTGPLHIQYHFFMPAIVTLRKQLNNKYHTKSPDLGRLIKYFENIATGILYADDVIIASIVAFKKYSSNPRTVVIIEEL